MNCSVVIPVYRGEATLTLLVERLGRVLPTFSDCYEVLLVNDGSPDKSWLAIENLAREYSWVRGIDLMRNYGQHNATLCGIRASRFEVICTMDDDLQNLPEELPKLIEKLNLGYDVVYGVARKRQQAWWKTLISSMLRRGISTLMQQNGIRDMGAFKAFRSDIVRSFEAFNSPDVLVEALLTWGTNRFAAVTVDEAPRIAGSSNYSFAKLIRVFFLVLTSYTTVPLRLASLVGFFFTLFGFSVLVYVVTIYFTEGSVVGFPFLSSIIAIFSGVQLFTLGIFGEYLARLFERSSGRKSYTIRRTTDETAT
jgi:undecaprenyl-phosphate 4-deoxy-4-formamido-L-arabinose transferase